MAGSSSGSAGPLSRSLPAVAGLLLSAYLIWALRSLIPPFAVGGLLAYICYPLVTGLERFRLTRGFAIGLLLLAFLFAGIFLVNRVRAGMPDDVGVLELRIRALHNVNRRYEALMGLDPSLTTGNRVYRLTHDDLDPLVNLLNVLLALTPEERSRFLSAHPDRADAPVERARPAVALPAMKARTPDGISKTPLAALGHTLSIWVVAPAVFLFLLRDTGEIKRGLLRAVPNRLFEPALAVLADLDRALGGYVRGLVLASSVLGISIALLLAVLGVPIGWAILIGLVSGSANPVPYVGSAVALLAGLVYSLFADEVRPMLPIIHAESVVVWMVVGVGMIELLKNLFLEPLLLGGATRVHPLVVLIGVLGGGIMFGLVGLLLAVPTITISRTLVSSTTRQLKAYGLI